MGTGRSGTGSWKVRPSAHGEWVSLALPWDKGAVSRPCLQHHSTIAAPRFPPCTVADDALQQSRWLPPLCQPVSSMALLAAREMVERPNTRKNKPPAGLRLCRSGFAGRGGFAVQTHYKPSAHLSVSRPHPHRIQAWRPRRSVSPVASRSMSTWNSSWMVSSLMASIMELYICMPLRCLHAGIRQYTAPAVALLRLYPQGKWPMPSLDVVQQG